MSKGCALWTCNLDHEACRQDRRREQTGVRSGHPAECVRRSGTRIELSSLRDPGPEPAADLAECVLGPKACSTDQRYQRDSNRLQDRTRLDPLVVKLLHRARQSRARAESSALT